MSFSEAEVETILDELRGGATVQRGGSRCHTIYYYRNGAFGWEDFDEGHHEDGPTSEAVIRDIIAGERDVAREALRAAFAHGDALGNGKVLDAVLAWPETAPSDEVVALVREKLRSLTAHHVLMRAVGWDRSPAVGAKGVEFADRLIAMIGCHYLRATFHEQAGDLAAAERDVLAELEHTPADSWQHAAFQEALERLRDRLAPRDRR